MKTLGHGIMDPKGLLTGRPRGEESASHPTATSNSENMKKAEVRMHTSEQRRKFITIFHANLVFHACISCFEVLQDTWHSNKENDGASWNLSGPTLRPPPYRAIGYSYTYRIYVFQCIAGYRATPPFWGVSQNYAEGGGGVWGGGYRSSSLPSAL